MGGQGKGRYCLEMFPWDWPVDIKRQGGEKVASHAGK